MLRGALTLSICAALLGCGSERAGPTDSAATQPAPKRSSPTPTPAPTDPMSSATPTIEPVPSIEYEREEPQLIFANVPTGKVKQLSVGNEHACAVMRDDTLSCWSSPDPDFGLGTVPAGKFRSVHVGASSTCARMIGGTMVCFSDGPSTPEVPSGPIEELCHDNDPCVRRADGTAECFNDGPDQQLGIVRPGSLTCGSSWSCGLTLAGTIRCAMVDSVAALGSEFMEPADWKLPVEPVERVFAGYQHGCAMKADGTVMCWGRDTAGETKAPSGVFTTLALGEKLSCGLRPDGSIECWGAAQPGPWPGPFTALGVTTHHDRDNAICAVQRNSTVECWNL